MSGWSYPVLGGGRFYPAGLKAGAWLEFYGGRFDTVEINSSSYRIPAVQTLERWREAVDEGFVFSVKLWRHITHELRLKGIGGPLRQFVAAAEHLGPKRGPLLVQLPPSLGRDLGLLRGFLEVAGGAQRVVVEFRSRDWVCDQTYDLLDRYGAAICLSDHPHCPTTAPNAAAFVYVRRHGPGGKYREPYGAEAIERDADLVRQWREAGVEVYVYYNNTIDGDAATDAAALRERVGECGLER